MGRLHIPATEALTAVFNTKVVEGSSVVSAGAAECGALVQGHVICSQEGFSQKASAVDEILVTARVLPLAADNSWHGGVDW